MIAIFTCVLSLKLGWIKRMAQCAPVHAIETETTRASARDYGSLERVGGTTASHSARSDEEVRMPNVMAVPRFERFFRLAAGLDVDKEDIGRFDEFVHDRVLGLLVMGEAHAKANGRDVIEPPDLPVTKGLQERIHEFEKMDAEVELGPVLERMADSPQLDLELSEEARADLAPIVGGYAVSLARVFTVVDPKVKNPASEAWERAARVFELLT
jgi:hypothetical protein